MDRLPYETTKQSIHFSLRALIARDFLEKVGHEKRRGRRRLLIDLGAAGKVFYGMAVAAIAPKGPSFVTDEETDGAEQLTGELDS